MVTTFFSVVIIFMYLKDPVRNALHNATRQHRWKSWCSFCSGVDARWFRVREIQSVWVRFIKNIRLHNYLISLLQTDIYDMKISPVASFSSYSLHYIILLRTYCGNCSFKILFFTLSGIDDSDQTSSHEMTIPNDVSVTWKWFLTKLCHVISHTFTVEVELCVFSNENLFTGLLKLCLYLAELSGLKIEGIKYGILRGSLFLAVFCMEGNSACGSFGSCFMY